MSRNLYWGVALLVGGLLIIPPFYQGKAVSFFVLGTLLAGLLAWLLLAFDQERFAQMSFGPALLLLLLSEAAAVITSKDPASSLNPFSTQIALLLLFILAYMLARHSRSVRPVLVIFFSMGVIITWYGLYQHLVGLLDTYQRLFGLAPPGNAVEQEIANRLMSRRAFAFFTYPNLFAGYMGMLLPVGFSLVFTASRQWSVWIWSIGIVSMVLGLYISGSLGGWMTATAGMVIFLYLWQNHFMEKNQGAGVWRIWIATGFLSLSGVFLICWLRGPGNFIADLLARLANWKSSFHMGADYLLTGIGPGMFGILFPDYQLEHGYYVRFAHNFILHRFAETGLIGIGSLFWFLFLVGRQLLHNLEASLEKSQKILIFGLIGGVSAGFLHATIDVDLNFLKTSMLFWFLLGTCLGFSTQKIISPLPLTAPFAQLVRWGLGLIGIMILWKGGKSLPVEGLLYWGTGFLLLTFFIGKMDSLTSWVQLVKRIPLRWPINMLLVWGVLAALVSLHPAGAISGLTLGIVGIIFYTLTVLTPRSGVVIIQVLAVSAVGLAVIALVQAALHPGVRVTAGWPNANLLAAFLAAGFLSNIVFLLFGSNTPKVQMFAALGALFIFFALLATGSIGGILNLLAGSAVLLIWIRRCRPHYFKLAILSLALMIVLIFLLPFQTGGRLTHLGSYWGQAYERLHMAGSALQMVRDRPITGYGPGNFSRAFERYNFPNVRGLARFGKQAQFAHNEFLHLMAVIGIPGGLLVIWIIWSMVIYFRRQLRLSVLEEGSTEAWENKTRIAAWCGLVGAAAHGLVDFNWHVPALFVWYMMLLGVAVAPVIRWKQDNSKSLLDMEAWLHRLNGLSRQPVLVLLLFVITAMATAAIRPLVSQYLQNLGAAHRYKQDLKAADRQFQRALSVHPFSAQVYDLLGQIRVDFYAVIGSENWYRLSEWAFKKAMVLDKLDAYIHRHLGTLYGLKAARLPEKQRQVQYDLAERQYWLAIEKSPRKALLYFELGNLLRDAGRLDAAERVWIKALELEPNYAAVLSNLGVVQEMRGDLKSAEANLRHALELKALAPNAQGKYELELLSLNWAVIHYNLGNLFERQGRWAEAQAEYKEVLQLEPDNPLAQKRLENLKKILP